MATFIEYSSMHPAGDEGLRTRIGEHDEDPIANTQPLTKPKITERVLGAGLYTVFTVLKSFWLASSVA